MRALFRRLLPLLLAAVFTAPAQAQATLPDGIAALLKKHRVARAQAGIVLKRLSDDATLINHQSDKAFNPASVVKLVTTMAAMDILGPDYRWHTTAATDGRIAGGVVKGNLYLIGGGDPYLTVDRFLYLINDLRSRGISGIDGDIVIDDSFFAAPPHDENAFDGAPLKPYNVGAGAMAVNFKATRVVFLPGDDGVRVYLDPPNKHITVKNAVKPGKGRCSSWRRRIRERYREDGGRAELSFRGSYAKRCGQQSFYVSVLSHESYVAGVFAALWERAGGGISGGWRRGRAPDNARAIAVYDSPPLTEVLAAMNKHSNNVIARNIFLSLSPPAPARDLAGARAAVAGWLRDNTGGDFAGAFIDNGSGLSRQTRLTPAQMARLLEAMWRHPQRADMVASLPIFAVDGTLKRRRSSHPLAGQGRFKTGSLNNVKAAGGFFRDGGGRPYLLAFFARGVSGARARALQGDILRWAYDLR